MPDVAENNSGINRPISSETMDAICDFTNRLDSKVEVLKTAIIDGWVYPWPLSTNQMASCMICTGLIRMVRKFKKSSHKINHTVIHKI